MTKYFTNIDIPIYKTSLDVFFGNEQECAEWLREIKMQEHRVKEWLENTDVKDINGMYTYFSEENVCLLWLKTVPETIGDYASLVHEIEHFVFYLFDRIGMEHTKASDEAYAYLMAFVFCKIDIFISEIKDSKTNNNK